MLEGNTRLLPPHMISFRGLDSGVATTLKETGWCFHSLQEPKVLSFMSMLASRLLSNAARTKAYFIMKWIPTL